MPMPFKIAVDDYGLHPQIDTAIRALAHRGIVKKVSVMANRDYAPDPLPDHIETGLHIDLTTFRSMGGGPLAPSPFQLLRKRDLSIQAVEDRVSAQLNHLTALGFRITHLDSHQHVHLISPILLAIQNVARAHNIRGVRRLTLQFRHGPFYMRSLLQCGFRLQMIKLLALYSAGSVTHANMAHWQATPNLILMPLAQSGNYEKLIHLIWGRFHDRDAELVTHPGLPAHVVDEPYVLGREIEYRALLDLADKHPGNLT